MNEKDTAHFFEPKLVTMAKAIALCIDNKLIEPALVLLYSAIDILGWLARSEKQSPKKGFIVWADKYLLNANSIACTASELYGARCGLLHALSFESQLSKQGQLRAISYAWGEADVAELQKSYELRGRSGELVAVHVSELYNAWLEGVSNFIEDVNKNPALRMNVYSKADRLFSSLKPSLVARTNNILEKSLKLNEKLDE